MPQTTTPPTLLPLGERPRLYRPYVVRLVATGQRQQGSTFPCSYEHDAPAATEGPEAGGTYGVSRDGLGPICWACAGREAPAHVLALVALMNDADRALSTSPPGWQVDTLAAAYGALDAVAAEHGLPH